MTGRTGLDLRVGDVVEVRPAAEILATLDENGELESLPFMPEMLRYCGQRLTVYKVANKACDTQTRSGMRRMENAVHLTGVRCDGSAHGGCQAACLIYWKRAWLRKVDPAEPASVEQASAEPASAELASAGPASAKPASSAEPVRRAAPAAEDETRLRTLLASASRGPAAADGAEVYRCQATELLRAAPQQLPMRDLGQFVEDVRTGNVGVLWSLRAFLVALYNRVQGLSNRYLPTWLRIRGGRQWGFPRGRASGPTPTGSTDLRPGDTVRIKSKREIEETLNSQLLNRGMGFDSEMARFCGRTARVARRVDQIIDERTGRMLRMKNPCIVLEGIVCEGAHNLSRPRAITPYWREIWLERVGSAPAPSDQSRSRSLAESVREAAG
jgi:hypothetical protein